MRTATLSLAVLLCASQAHAWPIGLGSLHCRCTLVPADVPVNPGWDQSLTLEQIAELQRLDDLHEPPAGTVGALQHVVMCFEEPTIPPGMGGGGGGSVPEPASAVLFGLAMLSGVRRMRRPR